MARPLVLALGGTRSGKSRFGLAATQRLAGDGRAWFLATAWPGDPEMDDRIARHRRERPGDWPTIEVGSDLVAALAQTEPSEPVLIDGLTLWLSAVMGDDPTGPDPVLDGPLAAALEAIAARPGPVVIVSDEVGWGSSRCTPAPVSTATWRGSHISASRRWPTRSTCSWPAAVGSRARPRDRRERDAGGCRRPDGARPRARRHRAARCDRDGAGSHRLDRLTKPPGSLGQLETVVIELAGITGRADPSVEQGVVVVAAGDHGVTRLGVSAYPSDVTAQMVANFVAGVRRSTCSGLGRGFASSSSMPAWPRRSRLLAPIPIAADGGSRRGSAMGPRI